LPLSRRPIAAQNACTINGNGKTFAGNTTLNPTTQYQVERLRFDGTNWDAF
jgi:hypothetical protein